MNLSTVENHEDIYRNSEIAEILMGIMTTPSEGKLKTIAEAGYSRFKNRFYAAYDDGSVVGILGISKADHGKCEILHFGVKSGIDMAVTGKAMINALKDERGDILELTVECAAGMVEFYRSCGFKEDRYKGGNESDLGFGKYHMRLKVRNRRD